ncbi:hypothetical protein IC615_22015 [Serratia ureilytica]
MAEIWAGSVSCTGSICSIRIVGRRWKNRHILQGSRTLSRMFVSSFYPFKINELSFNVNMLGDLGIHRQVKSSTVLKDFFLQARRSDVAADICFSDDRKIRVYEKIFRKYLTTNTQIYPFVELTLKPDKFMAFRFTEGGQARQASFINNLGREKDHRAFEYIEKHPLYHKIHYINKGNLYAVIGCSSECAELLDISILPGSVFPGPSAFVGTCIAVAK